MESQQRHVEYMRGVLHINTKQRILTIKLAQKILKKPKYAERIGLELLKKN